MMMMQVLSYQQAHRIRVVLVPAVVVVQCHRHQRTRHHQVAHTRLTGVKRVRAKVDGIGRGMTNVQDRTHLIHHQMMMLMIVVGERSTTVVTVDVVVEQPLTDVTENPQTMEQDQWLAVEVYQYLRYMQSVVAAVDDRTLHLVHALLPIREMLTMIKTIDVRSCLMTTTRGGRSVLSYHRR